jgi:hypothetical protein
MICSLWMACAAPPARVEEKAQNTESQELTPIEIQTDRGPVRFQVEVVDTPLARQKGLMYRTSLPEATGMLFVFPDEAQRSFWMRNTLIPLDMIFIRSDKTILGIVENAEPETDTSRSVAGNSQYVLELIGGSASRYRLSAGQATSFYTLTPDI